MKQFGFEIENYDLVRATEPVTLHFSIVFVSAVFGSQFPRFQKNYWYEYSTPPSTSYPGKFDFHISMGLAWSQSIFAAMVKLLQL